MFPGSPFPSPFRVVLDANVLYPFSVRDILLRAADAGFYQVYWSAQILDEATRNLVQNGQMTEAKAASLAATMSRAFPEALVTGYEHLVEAMQNDPKDRHVAAAAVKAAAQVIVTQNVRDFRNLPEGVEVQTADEFLCNLFDLDPPTMTGVVRDAAAGLRNPPRTVDDLLHGLSKIVPEFARHVREELQAARP